MKKDVYYSIKNNYFILFFIYLEIKLIDPINDIKKEIAIMKKLDHPNVIKLHEVIEDVAKEKLYMGRN